MRWWTLLALVGLVGCGSSEPPLADEPAAVAAVTSGFADADAAAAPFEDVLATYWDPARGLFFTNSDRLVDPRHTHGPDGGRYSDFWWSAHLWETVLDAWERTGDPRHRRLIDQVYDGFDAAHPTWANDFNDDLTWWALAATRAYALTGERRFLDKAAALFDAVWALRDDTYGGGVWWKRDGTDPQKGLCISAPLAMTAVGLFRATGEARYLDAARAEHAFVASRLAHAGGRLDDHLEGAGAGTVIEWQLTYDYGTWIGACVDLHEVTGEQAYLEQALRAAEHAVVAVTRGGVLQPEGDDDGAGFKMILTRQLARLGRQHGRPDLVAFVEHNARVARANRRPTDGLTGSDWSTPAPATPIQSFAAMSAAAVSLHAVAPRLVPTYPARLAAHPDPLRRVEAETGVLSGMALESRGSTTALAGWNGPGRVDLEVDVPADGVWAVAVRFSAGAGDASRVLLVDGAVAAPDVRFTGTPGWNDWRMVVVPRLALTAGRRTVSLVFDPALGSANWVNVDRLVLAPDPSNPVPLR